MKKISLAFALSILSCTVFAQVQPSEAMLQKLGIPPEQQGKEIEYIMHMEGPVGCAMPKNADAVQPGECMVKKNRITLGVALSQFNDTCSLKAVKLVQLDRIALDNGGYIEAPQLQTTVINNSCDALHAQFQ